VVAAKTSVKATDNKGGTMSNKQLIKTAHIWALVGVVLLAVIVFASKAESNPTDLAQQNTNSNTNSNTSRNQNQNENANTPTNRNANNSNATSEPSGTGGLSSQDQKFITDAAMGGLMEVHLGRMAAQLGENAAIKEFGRRMVEDHSKANTELAQLASTKGVTLPTEIDEKQQKEAGKLQRLKGADFDTAYAKRMVSDHNKKISAFEKESTQGTDADLKAFATKTLPTVREHLEMAKALPGNTGTGNTNSNANSNSNSNRP
jgi:putative membrane protein